MSKTIEQIFEETSVKLRAQMIDAVEAAIEGVYKDYMPHVENDTYFNVRQLATDWILHYMNDRVDDHNNISVGQVMTMGFTGKEIRAKIFQDNKEEIVALIGQDIVDRVKDLEERVAANWEVKYG